MPDYTPFNEKAHAPEKRFSKFILKAKSLVRKLQANLKSEASNIRIAAITSHAERLRLRTGEQLQQTQALSILIDRMRKERPRDIQEKSHTSRLRYRESCHFQSPPEQKCASTLKKERYLRSEQYTNRPNT